MVGNRTHRKLVRHYHEPGDFHELTFSCYRRMPLLSNDVWRERLPRSIESSCAESSFELVAFVYMPEHLHLLVYPKTREPKIGRFLARLKQPFSKEIKRILINSRSSLLDKLTVRERPGKHCFRFWQEGPGFDRNVYPPKFFKHLSTTFTTPRPSVDSASSRRLETVQCSVLSAGTANATIRSASFCPRSSVGSI